MTGRWESDVVLTDGGTVHLRPAREDDEAAILALYQSLSDESVYFRFFSPVSRPVAAHLDRFADVDERDHVTLVAQLGDELLAVARYDRVGADEAEVAFTVRDTEQGRGLATLMLEHLAVVARANGIRVFSADTLPANSRMLGVFRSAGWATERAFESGAVHLRFSIEPTAGHIAAVQEREHLAEAESVARLLAPRSIAVVGASRHAGAIGHEVLRNLLAYEFRGPVFPVNPTTTSVAGVHAYASVLDVPDPLDLAIVVVPAAAVPDVVAQCAQKHVRGLVIISAGFAEIGSVGATVQRDLVKVARANGMRIIGPNCLGVVSTAPEVRMNATFAPDMPIAGNVGFMSQSGGLGIELMARAGDLGLGISEFVAVGNKADVSGNDLLQHWEQDPRTDVILLYLESFGNPRKFARLARRISHSKPIVAVKSGRTPAGSRAASSHTAALAAPDVAVDALFRQAGVVRVDTLEDLLATGMVLAHQPLPRGRRVAIVSNAGGPGILAADACAGVGLEVAELAPETQDKLRGFVAGDASIRNPIDLVASATADDFERTLRVLLADASVDALIVIFTPPLVTRAEDVARATAAVAADAGDIPIVACFLGVNGVPELLRGDEHRRTVPSFAFPEAAARALGRAADLADWRRRPEGQVPDFDDIDIERARALIADALATNVDGEWLDAETAAAVLGCFGVPVAPVRVATNADDAARAADAVGYPVVVKAAGAELVHKSDVGGVALDLTDERAVREAFTTMTTALGARMTGAIVQHQCEPGTELIVGSTQDPLFGPIVLFGLGGVTAELLADHALRIVPITDEDAREQVRALRGSPLLFGYRGAPPVDAAAIENILLRIGQLADALPEVSELDLNPVIAGPDGVIAVDVKVRVEPAAARVPPDLRRLSG